MKGRACNLKYHNITHDDMLNGKGLRVVLWVSGCSHHCKNCHNPVTWNPDDGLEFDEAAKAELFSYLKKDYIDGLTLSGGDPLYKGNVDTISPLITEIREKFPDKTIWMYTGYTFEELFNKGNEKLLECVKKCDVLVDGKFVEELKNVHLPYRGSSNQRLINIQQTLNRDHITNESLKV